MANVSMKMAQGLSGNLCRCQDYDKILNALMRETELSRGAKHA
jgi:carbon-monoxide dehydrogenase small subunit/xanthine dehydrogenase YagT iron-sulfur-binding subunit